MPPHYACAVVVRYTRDPRPDIHKPRTTERRFPRMSEKATVLQVDFRMVRQNLRGPAVTVVVDPRMRSPRQGYRQTAHAGNEARNAVTETRRFFLAPDVSETIKRMDGGELQMSSALSRPARIIKTTQQRWAVVGRKQRLDCATRCRRNQNTKVDLPCRRIRPGDNTTLPVVASSATSPSPRRVVERAVRERRTRNRVDLLAHCQACLHPPIFQWSSHPKGDSIDLLLAFYDSIMLHPVGLRGPNLKQNVLTHFLATHLLVLLVLFLQNTNRIFLFSFHPLPPLTRPGTSSRGVRADATSTESNLSWVFGGSHAIALLASHSEARHPCSE
ncbi:hypothetical protein K438DRAFT_1936686 [Mycena galopus ATCC 62051]|nr:hypothetical protein K438DRAFT_1936686 [Mycena galopus ATCC 62051]